MFSRCRQLFWSWRTRQRTIPRILVEGRNFVGKIESLWAGWGGQMTVKVKWFYHPEETKGGKTLAHPKGALFESPHGDENDVQTISHKCQVLTYREYTRRAAEATRKGHTLDQNTYYQAGFYDPTIGMQRLEPDVQ